MTWDIVAEFINCECGVERPLAQGTEPKAALFGRPQRLCVGR